MKIAVASAPGSEALAPFGRGSDLSIWRLQGSTVVERTPVRQDGGCCGGLARSVLGVDVVLCTNIGHGAMSHLVEQGTAVACAKRDGLAAEEVVRLWLSGARDEFFVAARDCDHTGCGGEHEHPHQHD
jgi:predicted Fe-Mo cluster-binding NifX family protein